MNSGFVASLEMSEAQHPGLTFSHGHDRPETGHEFSDQPQPSPGALTCLVPINVWVCNP